MFDSDTSRIPALSRRGYAVGCNALQAIESDPFRFFAPVHVAIPFRGPTAPNALVLAFLEVR